MSYVPVHVRSGVKRDSEEGTELVVVHKYDEEIRQKRTLYHVGTFLSWFGLLMLFGCFYLPYVIAWLIPYTRPWVTWMLVGFAILAVVMIALGVFLYNIRERFVSVIREVKEKQITIFIPSISITDVNDIVDIYMPPSRYGELLEWRGIPFESATHKNVVPIGDGVVSVVGFGPRGEEYGIELQSPDLYNRIMHEYNEFLRQVKFREYQSLKERLEYLEKVGRYEEAARIYETLDMPEKAGEMRRKKREIVMLDLNALIRQLGERGFTVTYRCSHCGAPVSISGETKAEAVQYCSHCGSRIETIDLANFIKKYLS
jgi:DNA-directed RNA polymerase subunit RPC12/RpoP